MPAVTTTNLLTILIFSRPRFMAYRLSKYILAMKPAKNTTATVARISPVFRLTFLCSGVMSQLRCVLQKVHGSSDDSGRGSVQLGRRLKGVKRHGRGNFPLQAFGPFPRFLWRFLPLPAHCGQHDEEDEIDLRKAEEEGPHRGDGIEVSELHRVIRVASGHTRQTQKVHREEGHVERDQRPPEMDLAA